MRPGVRLAVDVGTTRIGVARSDASGILAVPLDAVSAREDSIQAVTEVAREWEAIEVIVGLPLHMDAREGASAQLARTWAGDLQERTGLPVRLLDERLSTVQAQQAMRQAGRSTRQSRSLIDSASAVMVLQAALDFEARTGRPAGESIADDEAVTEGEFS